MTFVRNELPCKHSIVTVLYCALQNWCHLLRTPNSFEVVLIKDPPAALEPIIIDEQQGSKKMIFCRLFDESSGILGRAYR
jgi:hypothetical protein